MLSKRVDKSSYKRNLKSLPEFVPVNLSKSEDTKIEKSDAFNLNTSFRSTAETSFLEQEDCIKTGDWALLQWTDVSYYVPAKSITSALEDIIVADD